MVIKNGDAAKRAFNLEVDANLTRKKVEILVKKHEEEAKILMANEIISKMCGIDWIYDTPNTEIVLL